jgi:hypothetical protein
MVAAERELTPSQRSARRFVHRAVFPDLFERAKQVWRFEGVLPAEEMRRIGLRENVDAHTRNCQWRATWLPVGERSWAIIDRGLALHDLPEVEISDVLAYEITSRRRFTVSRRVAVKRDERERAAAQELKLSAEDQWLIHQIQLARQALEGKRIDEPILQEAVIVAIVDFSDASESFHIRIPWWIDTSLESYFNRRAMPKDKALTYAIETYRRYMDSLPKLGLDDEFLILAKALLVETLSWIVVHWGQIRQKERIPRKMKKKLEWAGQELKQREAENLPSLVLPIHGFRG